MGFTVTVVCLGNICRSPMAEAVLRDRLAAAGLDTAVHVRSAGTSGWHVGDDADPRALAALRRRGYSLDHSAQSFAVDWFDEPGLVLAMDCANHRTLEAIRPPGSAPLSMFRAFDPALAHYRVPHAALDVPDPYYGGDGGFDEVLDMLEAAGDGVVEQVRRGLLRST